MFFVPALMLLAAPPQDTTGVEKGFRLALGAAYDFEVKQGSPVARAEHVTIITDQSRNAAVAAGLAKASTTDHWTSLNTALGAKGSATSAPVVCGGGPCPMAFANSASVDAAGIIVVVRFIVTCGPPARGAEKTSCGADDVVVHLIRKGGVLTVDKVSRAGK